MMDKNQKPSSVRVAIDIGGTFTDAVLETESDRHTVKVLTTSNNPADAFMESLYKLINKTDFSAGDIELITHGTTLATNALIERKGAKTALLVTHGHRDSIEIAYENRFDQYNFDAKRNEPLIPRKWRWGIKERINFRGDVLTEIDMSSLAPILEKIESNCIESIAVGFLHSYANPDHEFKIREILLDHFPLLSVSISSEVCPEIREYERQTTTATNAYIQPMMATYLNEIQDRLNSDGFHCPCLLMTSGGHQVTIKTATQFPVRLIESGPAGGAILASNIAKRLDESRILSFDMGGTTAKICLIEDSELPLSRTFEIDRAHRFMKGSGMPIKVPVVEMVEIGAGGGSLASVDKLKRVLVGPLSSAADPGPACYGRGGTKPAVTDANLILGRIDAKKFAGGEIQLDKLAASASIKKYIATPLAHDLAQSANAIIEIVEENMANAARVHAIEGGKDITDRTLIGFGGGAPLHAISLAKKLGIGRVIIPTNAGVGSAIGFLMAPVAYEVVRSRFTLLDQFDADPINKLFQEMQEEARRTIELAANKTSIEEQRYAYIRYTGQGHEIKIELPNKLLTKKDQEIIKNSFEDSYRTKFGQTIPGMQLEILTWSLVLTSVSNKKNEESINNKLPRRSGNKNSRPLNKKRVDFGPGSGIHDCPIYERNALIPNEKISGPAIISESQTTIVIPKGWTLNTNQYGDLVITHDLIRDDKHFAEDVANDMKLSSIRGQVIWDRLISIVEEQAQALVRTAFSTTVREAGDLSAGIFDLSGKMLAQAVTGTPGHVNAMAASVGYFLEKLSLDKMNQGDVFITNDPWLGTGHLFDFTAVTPAFLDNKVIGLFASTIHVVDIGGRGFGPDAGQVYEEGLCIPILPIFEKGVANETILEIVRTNVREPEQVIGDLYSLSVGNEVGCRRLVDMMKEFYLYDLDQVSRHITSRSRQAMLDAISNLPKGSWVNEMVVDGYGVPITLKAELTISETGIDIDFSGTSSVSSYGINVPLSYTEAYASFGIRCVIGNQIPNNAGSLEPIRILAPDSCILNAPRPHAVAVRHVIGQMLPDVVLGCFEKALPGVAPAEGSSSLWNPMITGGPGLIQTEHGNHPTNPFSVTIFHSGGTGALPWQDGLSATAFPSGVRNTPVEITESVTPILFHQKEYRTRSGGSGKFRGGHGQIIEIEHSEGIPFAIFALFDRIDHPARGRAGGRDGAPGFVRLASGKKLKGKGKQIVPAGQKLIMGLPGGGGYGNPSERDSDLAQKDIDNELEPYS